MVTRKLTKAIRASIANQYNKEVVNPQLSNGYVEKMIAYINNTPDELLKMKEKYPSAINTCYISGSELRYIDYGNVPKVYIQYYPDNESPTSLSLDSLTTFDDVREILPHLAKYLPA